uniref:MARVEL domain-containing protein n=1 Tax=Cyprinus carpio TaxID=7962 RepID=A0A8C1GZQ6_CYPCA
MSCLFIFLQKQLIFITPSDLLKSHSTLVIAKMEKPKFSLSALTSTRGALHIAQIVVCAVTFAVSYVWGKPLHTYWIYCMVVWGLCPIISLIITIVEMFLIHKLILVFCMDWDDFTTGMAMMASLCTCSCTAMFANFYICRKCIWGWMVTILSVVCCALYCVETFRDKCDATRSATYVAALPGFIKILEAFVGCIILISLIGYVGKPALLWCIVAYAVPLPLTLLTIITNILTKLKNCLPFSIDRFTMIFLVISVLLYISAAILWPTYSFKENPRPKDCPGNSCIWSIQFVVTFMTYINLGLYVADLVLTCLGICGFKRSQ